MRHGSDRGERQKNATCWTHIEATRASVDVNGAEGPADSGAGTWLVTRAGIRCPPFFLTFYA